jgi:hypothetical protein
MPNKIGLAREDYFVVQQIYSGWNKFALVLLVQVVALATAVWLTRRQREVALSIVIALACVVVAQAVFWIWTFPANAATVNWTMQPDDWQKLRRDWEYSHLGGAVLQFVGVLSLVVALARRARLLGGVARG